jgi:ABC-2 type transport system permease protein
VNVYLHELRANRRTAIIWAVSMSALIVLYLLLYPAFTSDVAATKQLLSSLPPAVRSALDISLETFFSIYGFYAYILSFAILAASIQGMNVGTGAISKEISGKTVDFLFSKPVKRHQLVSAKLAAALTTIAITDAVFAVVAYLMAELMTKKPMDAKIFFLQTATLGLVQLMFFALGALFSVVVPKIKSVVSVSLPTVFAFYIIGVIGDVVQNKNLRYLSPFKYYNPIYIIKHGAIETKFLLIDVVFVIVAILATYLIMAKKNIRAAV